MPNRFIKETICTSDTLAQLSAEEERFFYRLLVQCDDFGRCDARPHILRAKCFSAMLHVVTENEIARWLKRLSEVGLIYLYEVEGKPYLQFVTWERHQQRRAAKSKHPDIPTDDEGRYRLISDVITRQRYTNNDIRITNNEIRSNVRSSAGADEQVGESSVSATAQEDSSMDTSEQAEQRKRGEYPAEFEEWWSVYPNKIRKAEAYRRWQRCIKTRSASAEELLEAARNYAAACKGRDPSKIMHPPTFLNPDNQRWKDFLGKIPDAYRGVGPPTQRVQEPQPSQGETQPNPYKRVHV